MKEWGDFVGEEKKEECKYTESRGPQYITDEIWLMIESPEREEVPFDLDEFLYDHAKAGI
ncbi:hypothetical protein [Paenibacillus sp.]|jgi:hypothetical protein|uniref:hypothetical protein n=1 Tax=Paenibacillus sp. TaxID=58172 RepID=UPI00282AD485|nr:hypothetical protein [Paenibacillus sp.]MDR0266947.1 hypothetical protein [Paenibacillus sp.]